jgi:FkbM family methyltransferase
VDIKARGHTIGMGVISWTDRQSEPISRFIQPEWHYADIGACVGDTTDFLWPKMERGYIFEPSSINCDFLRQKYSFLSADKLIINQVAVSSQEGLVDFSINLNDPSVGSINGTLPARVRENYLDPDRLVKMGLPPTTFGGVYYHEKIESVKTVTLDAFFKDKRIDLIKVDAEGSEWDIFKGAKEIMSTRSIIFQVEFHWEEDWSQRSILRDLNYNIYTTKDWVGEGKARNAFKEKFFTQGSSCFQKLPNDAPMPQHGIVAKEDRV